LWRKKRTVVSSIHPIDGNKSVENGKGDWMNHTVKRKRDIFFVEKKKKKIEKKDKSVEIFPSQPKKKRKTRASLLEKKPLLRLRKGRKQKGRKEIL